MAEEKEKIVLIATHGGEDPERAVFPFLWSSSRTECVSKVYPVV
jgi:hypothetical protein